MNDRCMWIFSLEIICKYFKIQRTYRIKTGWSWWKIERAWKFGFEKNFNRNSNKSATDHEKDGRERKIILFWFNNKPMKRIQNLSVTKLTFFIIVVELCFLVNYAIIANVDNEILKTILNIFNYAVTSMISFYFGQKVAEMKEVDAFLKKDEWNKE